ncbi:uncharacterized protein LOC121385013 isoform X2 [Gigantopelta aegis]|uniref:uncharacterized protein LOC121385013 isoform X2 n=1 Tax=Gigantopelta aegis TaxID=1735272 RepID=UPI001B88B07A|nr:uncharacterized protein LOC121385013 isoform X2 [Gigantopelta aegis]
MYSGLLFVLFLFNALWITRQRTFSACLNSCNIVNQVLECLRLVDTDLSTLASCVTHQRGPLIIDIRKHQLECTCRFLDFIKTATTDWGFLMLHNTKCSAKNIETCGVKPETKPASRLGVPVYALFGGQVFDVTSRDLKAQLISMDKQQRRVIKALASPLVRLEFNAARKTEFEKNIADAETLSAMVSKLDTGELFNSSQTYEVIEENQNSTTVSETNTSVRPAGSGVRPTKHASTSKANVSAMPLQGEPNSPQLFKQMEKYSHEPGYGTLELTGHGTKKSQNIGQLQGLSRELQSEMDSVLNHHGKSHKKKGKEPSNRGQSKADMYFQECELIGVVDDVGDKEDESVETIHQEADGRPLDTNQDRSLQDLYFQAPDIDVLYETSYQYLQEVNKGHQVNTLDRLIEDLKSTFSHGKKRNRYVVVPSYRLHDSKLDKHPPTTPSAEVPGEKSEYAIKSDDEPEKLGRDEQRSKCLKKSKNEHLSEKSVNRGFVPDNEIEYNEELHTYHQEMDLGQPDLELQTLNSEPQSESLSKTCVHCMGKEKHRVGERKANRSRCTPSARWQDKTGKEPKRSLQEYVSALRDSGPIKYTFLNDDDDTDVEDAGSDGDDCQDRNYMQEPDKKAVKCTFLHYHNCGAHRKKSENVSQELGGKLSKTKSTKHGLVSCLRQQDRNSDRYRQGSDMQLLGSKTDKCRHVSDNGQQSDTEKQDTKSNQCVQYSDTQMQCEKSHKHLRKSNTEDQLQKSDTNLQKSATKLQARKSVNSLQKSDTEVQAKQLDRYSQESGTELQVTKSDRCGDKCDTALQDKPPESHSNVLYDNSEQHSHKPGGRPRRMKKYKYKFIPCYKPHVVHSNEYQPRSESVLQDTEADVYLQESYHKLQERISEPEELEVATELQHKKADGLCEESDTMLQDWKPKTYLQELARRNRKKISLKYVYQVKSNTELEYKELDKFRQDSKTELVTKMSDRFLQESQMELITQKSDKCSKESKMDLVTQKSDKCSKESKMDLVTQNSDKCSKESKMDLVTQNSDKCSKESKMDLVTQKSDKCSKESKMDLVTQNSDKCSKESEMDLVTQKSDSFLQESKTGLVSNISDQFLQESSTELVSNMSDKFLPESETEQLTTISDQFLPESEVELISQKSESIFPDSDPDWQDREWEICLDESDIEWQDDKLDKELQGCDYTGQEEKADKDLEELHSIQHMEQTDNTYDEAKPGTSTQGIEEMYSKRKVLARYYRRKMISNNLRRVIDVMKKPKMPHDMFYGNQGE